ncbi:MAG: hypothetical protein Q4G08_10345 [Capnocytophaga sp.]|nr:hypothetical protein [Capnocytophaga sp.]
MKYLNIIVFFSILFSSQSCEKEGDSYNPVIASNVIADINVIIVDAEGNDLLADEKFVETISIYSHLSRKDKTLEIKNNTGKKYIKFNADLPEEKAMNPIVKSDTVESKGNSEMTLTAGNDTVHLTASFLYRNRTVDIPEMYGGTGIYITEVKCNEKIVNEDNTIQLPNHQGGRLVLQFVYDKGKLSLQ